MNRLSLSALALAALLATPAFADDVWDMPDAVSKTVTAQKDDKQDGAAEDKAADQEAADKDAADKEAGGESTGDAAADTASPGFAPINDHTGNADDPYQFSADAQPAKGAGSAPARDERTSNVLGPLWGVPQDAPVMKNIDPELEMQYAKDSQGRLVPRSELSKEDAAALKEQEKQERERERQAQREQERAAKEAKAEQKRLEKEQRAAEKQREREEREAQKQREREAGDRDKAAPPDVEPERAGEPDAVPEPGAEADSADEDQAIYDSMRAGKNPEDEGW